MIPRPKGVPRQALYSMHDGWWQVGELVDGKPFGRWKTFRPDGSALFEARFDSKGRLQGAFKRFHPDGSLAREATYAHGKLTGRATWYRAKGATGDLFPASDPRAWRVVIDFADDGSEDSRTLLDERGIELADDRTAAETAALGALDPLFAGATPDGFLASGALSRVVATLPAAPPIEADELWLPVELPARRPLDARRFGELYGQPTPPALKAWLEATAGDPAFYGMRVARDNDVVAATGVVEALIAEHQAASGRTVGLRALVSGVVPIGLASDGRLHYCASISETPEAPTDAVYAINPSEDAFQTPVARTLDDFAYAVALIAAAEREAVSLPILTPAYERLRGRVDLRDPMTSWETTALEDADEDDEVEGDTEKDHREGFHFRRGQIVPAYFFYRNRWLLTLLGGSPEGAAAKFEPSYDGGLNDERFERILKNANQPWVAFYWCFRSLVFQDPRLPKLLAVCSDQPSQLTREIAKLVGELAAGRKPLGEIADFQAVLARFRALDPMANKPESEDEDASDEDASDEAATPEVPPELAPAAAIVAWARDEGYSRENLIIKYELDVAALGLARRAEPGIVPLIAEVVDDRPWLGARLLEPWFETGRADWTAILPKAREWLRARDDGALYKWTAGAGVLAAAKSSADGKLVADVLELCLDDLFTRGLGMESAMSTMAVEEAIEPLCRAAMTLGISESLIAALEGLVGVDNHLVDDVRGHCALALASVGRGLEAIVKGVRGQLAEKHGHRITSGQLEAIGILGAREPEHRADMLELVKTIPKVSDEAFSGLQCALHDLGDKRDLPAMFQQLLAKKRYKNDEEDAAEDRARLLATVARRADLPGELALEYVASEHVVLHRAAVRTLQSKGLAIPDVTLYDPYYVNQLDRAQLHAALDDAKALQLGNVCLWLGDHPDPSSREPLTAFVRRIAARGRFPEEGPRHYELRWAVRALLAIGGADRVFDELLSSSDRNLAEPLLRYPEKLTPAVARGMTHVFVHDEHWRHSVAKKWLAKHKADPRVAAALAEHGLAIEDVTKKDAQ